MMTKFRLHSILKRLNAAQKREDDTGDGYVCCNKVCYAVYKVRKIMDLLSEGQSTGKKSKNGGFHFACGECGEPLIDAAKYYENSNSTLSKTMRFNLQMKSLRQLLT